MHDFQLLESARVRLLRPFTWALCAAAVCGLSVSGCGAIVPVSSHTVRVAEHRDADVVWVSHGGILMRCSDTRTGPVCVEVREP